MEGSQLGLTPLEFKIKVEDFRQKYSVFTDPTMDCESLKAHLYNAIETIGLASNVHYKEKIQSGWDHESAQNHQQLYLDWQYHLLDSQLKLLQQTFEKEELELNKDKIKIIE